MTTETTKLSDADYVRLGKCTGFAAQSKEGQEHNKRLEKIANKLEKIK